MPQFLADYHAWWMQLWVDHPILFWVAMIVAVALTVTSNLLRRS